MTWIKRIVYHDGGRREAGFRMPAEGDCVVRALSIVTGTKYLITRQSLQILCGKERGPNKSDVDNGVYAKTYQRFLKALPGVRRGRCRTWQELPTTGRVFVELGEHVVAYIDGVIYDTFDPVERPDEIKGYWHFG